MPSTLSSTRHHGPSPATAESKPAARRGVNPRSWRQLLVWLHVVSSVSWMSQVTALCTLLAVSMASPPGQLKHATVQVAELLDGTVLVLSANMSALTGFLLTAVTTWGYFHHWWVTIKFVITFGQLFAGIFVLSAAMPELVAAAAAGNDGPIASITLASGLMAGALAFQAWLSVAKPGGRTPLAQRADIRPIGAPGRLVMLAVFAVLADLVLGIALLDITDPVPAFCLIVLTVAVVLRTRRHRASRRKSAPSTTLPAVVTAIEALTPNVKTLRLTRPDGAELPAWAPGAHIDLVLPSGRIRQYSLHGDPTDRAGYDVAVLREPGGRGGSIEIHNLTEGEKIRITAPRNNFPLVDATSYLFIAGGIGVTPLVPMLEQVAASGLPYTLLYRGRDLRQMPFATELQARYGEHVQIFPADTTARPDLAAAIATLPEGAVVYCCGPDSLITAVTAVSAAFPQVALHLERFVPTAKDDEPNTPFEVRLHYSQRDVTVDADTSMLDAMRAVLPDLPASCENGLCGSCETRVLAGRPDHRDDILHGPQRDRVDVIYPCVSRSRDPRLVVDA